MEKFEKVVITMNEQESLYEMLAEYGLSFEFCIKYRHLWKKQFENLAKFTPTEIALLLHEWYEVKN